MRRDLCQAPRMGFITDVLEHDRFSPPTAFEFARQTLDMSWIEEALAATGKASIRRRKLPAENVVWLVIAMALFRDRSIVAAANHLGLISGDDSRGGRGRVVGASVAEARKRLGPKPVERLFRRTGRKWGFEAAAADAWRGLSVFAIDGTTLRVADTTANDAHFGRHGTGRGRPGYPQARMVALMATRSHLLVNLAVGPLSSSEVELAETLWPEVPDNSLTLVDRGFLSYGRLYRFNESGTERHWLTRTRKNTRFEVVQELSDGSALVRLKMSSHARAKDKTLPRTMTVRAVTYATPSGTSTTVLTSLTDAERFPADEVAALYHERWEIEMAFDEKKTHMLERMESLRSKTVEGTMQEIWGIGLAYNLIRLMMLDAARTAELPAIRMSFRYSVSLIRAFALSAWTCSPGTLPKLLRHLKQDLADSVLPPRRMRSYPRAVKIKMSGYAKKRELGDDDGA